MTTVTSQRRTVLDELTERYGPSIVFHDANGRRIRLHQQGFWSVFDVTQGLWYPQPFEQNSGEARFWSEKYLTVKAQQTQENFEEARNKLLLTISMHVERMDDLPTDSDLEEQKVKLRELKRIADEAHQELDEKVYAPAAETARKQQLFEAAQVEARSQRAREVAPIVKSITEEFGKPEVD